MRLLNSGVRGLASLPSIPRNVRAAQLYGAAQVSGALGTHIVPESRFYQEVLPTSASEQRLSAAARLGSSKVLGHAVVTLPDALEAAAAEHVLRANKAQLRRDATHQAALEQTPTPRAAQLDLPPQHSFQASLRGSRASALYLATQLPARYAILTRVLDEVQRRIPSPHGAYAPSQIVDWNAQALDALWASLTVFGGVRAYRAEAWSRALLATGTQLVRELGQEGAPMHDALAALHATVRLRGDRPASLGRAPPATLTGETLGLSAFHLSALPSDVARERQVERMWKSGAETLLLIEDATPRGFACIAAARAQLLALGSAAPSCHVVAPCPHDKACPLLHATPAPPAPSRAVPSVCSYTQLYHAPSFTRATLGEKRSDRLASFCYTVVRRGPRPALADAEAAWHAAVPQTPRAALSAAVQALSNESRAGILDALRSERPQVLEADCAAPDADVATGVEALRTLGIDAAQVMQLDAYTWPRLVRTPLKKGGHVTLDACRAHGAVERFTVAKSAGRQAYQDARKARHGELYAHAHKSGRPTLVRAAPDAERPASGAAHAAPQSSAPERASTPAPEAAYATLGPDAQAYARAAPGARMPHRAAHRAARRFAALDAERATRPSRKPNRARLDAELFGDVQAYP